MATANSEEFIALIEKLLHNCNKRGILMMPYEIIRTPATQAKYWKQGRTSAEVKLVVDQMLEVKASFLAQCLIDAEHLGGPVITNALPGFSWHQWGEAVDCYWLYDNRKIWELDFRDPNGNNGYEVYAEEAADLSLEAGFFWKGFVDAPHVQYQKSPSPKETYSMKEINDIMEARYKTKKKRYSIWDRLNPRKMYPRRRASLG